MGVDEVNLLLIVIAVIGVERYILTSSNYCVGIR